MTQTGQTGVRLQPVGDDLQIDSPIHQEVEGPESFSQFLDAIFVDNTVVIDGQVLYPFSSDAFYDEKFQAVAAHNEEGLLNVAVMTEILASIDQDGGITKETYERYKAFIRGKQ